MKKINVQLFSTPTIKYGDDLVVFSLKKAEALFYYLLVKRKAYRDELIGLLFSDMPEQKARKNLRNALYKVRNRFKEDLKIVSKGDIIELKLSDNLKCDYYSKSTEDYKDVFLENFYVKNAKEFNMWVEKERRIFKEAYMSKLNEKIKDSYAKGKFHDVIDLAIKYIQEDEFDERVYRILMNAYVKEGVHVKGINLYKQLESLLQSELGVCPDDETRALYEEIINNDVLVNNHNNDEFFYGRKYEINELNKYLNTFAVENYSNAVFITGEVGIGKTKLKDFVLNQFATNDINILKINCSKIEEKCPLRPFTVLLESLVVLSDGQSVDDVDIKAINNIIPALRNDIRFKADINYNYIENSIIDIFSYICKENKILLVIDDFQWIDDISQNLLARLIYNIKDNFMLFGVIRDDYKYSLKEFFMNLKNLDKYREILLRRFNQYECGEFVRKGLLDNNITDDVINNIYKETEGNTCFLVETINILKHGGNLNVLTAKMKDILESRIMQVSKEGRNLLNIMSLFSDLIPLDILNKISSADEIDILDVIDELQRRNLIKEEIRNNKVVYSFTHIKLKEFLYMNLSHTKKAILHGKIARVLKMFIKASNTDIALYTKIIYHYTRANNLKEVIKYTMEYADLQLSFNHELFPNFYDVNMCMDRLSYIQKNNAMELFTNIEKLIERYQDEQGFSKETKVYKLEFLYMLGRYYIREGKYDEGIQSINEVIKKSKGIDDGNEYIIKAYKQLIYYCIQIDDSEGMTKYLTLLNKFISDDINNAIYLRLNGLNKIMHKDYVNAESMLYESIAILNRIDEDNPTLLLNIAAAYNYIGDIKRYNKEYKKALKYYDKAIDICYSLRAIKGLTVFYTNAGLTSYEMNDLELTKQYLYKAEEVFGLSGSIWKRSIHEGVYAMILAKEGKVKEALYRIKKAKAYCDRVKNPFEMEFYEKINKEMIRLKER